MAYIKVPDRDQVLDRKMAQLQTQLYNMERQMEEQADIRRKVEQIQNKESSRVQQAVDRANSRNSLMQEEIERLYNSPSPASGKLLEEVMTLRTKEFQKSQAKKAATIKHLAHERVKIMEARNKLKEKNDMFRSVPSPIGKETQKFWGHKYSLYTPLSLYLHPAPYSPLSYRDSWVPEFDNGYYTFFPRKKQKKVKIYNPMYKPC